MIKFFNCHVDKRFCIIEIVIDRLLFMESSTILDGLKHKITELDYPNLILDMDRVKTLDSSGIGLLISINRLMDTHMKKLAIVNDDPNVQRLLRNAGLEKYFQIFNKLGDATSYFLSNEKASN
jgi:anti-anti-sigma factor